MDSDSFKSFILAFSLVFSIFVFHFIFDFKQKYDLNSQVNCALFLHQTENLTNPDILKLRQEVTENCFK